MAKAMRNRVSQNVSLTGELSAFVQSLVNSGRYGSTSEVVRAGLRLLAELEQQQAPKAVKAADGARDAR
jgi:antitoxin ParD1/3/4